MRLINVRTRELKDYVEGSVPKYAILSHTWGPDEVTFDDYMYQTLAQTKAGYAKIEYTCLQTIKDGIDFVWIDTCSIQKSSSAELSEAINSMYRWYQQSQVCYAYLEDFQVLLEPEACPNPSPMETIAEQLNTCRWFSRGWTLQEMIAPPNLVFYGKSWSCFGTKHELRHTLSCITGVDEAILQGKKSCSEASVAQRLSWAARRQTTRIEDTAYCLLGIFDVNMPLLYGERDQAFLRLQEEIMKKNDDPTILAWWGIAAGEQKIPTTLQSSIRDGFKPCGILATTISQFALSSNYVKSTQIRPRFATTARGLSAQLRSAKFMKGTSIFDSLGYRLRSIKILALGCRDISIPGTQVSVIVMHLSGSRHVRYGRFLGAVRDCDVKKTPKDVLLETRIRAVPTVVVFDYLSRECVITPAVSRFVLQDATCDDFDLTNNQIRCRMHKTTRLVFQDTSSAASFVVLIEPRKKWIATAPYWHTPYWQLDVADASCTNARSWSKSCHKKHLLIPQTADQDGLVVHAYLKKDYFMGRSHWYLELEGVETKDSGGGSFSFIPRVLGKISPTS